MDSVNAMILLAFRPLSLPAAVCQPAGSVPVCSHGILKADAGELFQPKTTGLIFKDLPIITVFLLGQNLEMPGQ